MKKPPDFDKALRWMQVSHRTALSEVRDELLAAIYEAGDPDIDTLLDIAFTFAQSGYYRLRIRVHTSQISAAKKKLKEKTNK